jgi:hypothetical protein
MRLLCKGRSTPPPPAARLRPLPRRQRARGRLIALLALLALPTGASAQADCRAIPASAGAPDLGEFSLLFRQAGVAFSARTGEQVAVAVANLNDFPVTVDFGTSLEVGPDSLRPGEVFLGRRCIRLAAGQAAAFPVPEAPDQVRGVRLRNLSITGLSEPAQGEAPVTRPFPSPEAAPAAAPPRAEGEQFGCSTDPGSAAGRACTASYLAASARAAVLAGAFAGVSRDCLLEYAARQEQSAALLRGGGAAAGAAAPTCFSQQSARWDFAMLRRFCPDAVWTPENRGVTSCSLPETEPARPAPQPPPGAAARAGEGEGGRDTGPERTTAEEAPASEPARRDAPRPADGLAMGIQTVLRLLFGAVLTLAGLALTIPVLQATALLLLVAPATLLRRIRREEAAD